MMVKGVTRGKQCERYIKIWNTHTHIYIIYKGAEIMMRKKIEGDRSDKFEFMLKILTKKEVENNATQNKK